MLEINNLRMYYDSEEGQIHAVDGVDLTLEKEENLGLVGESGSGKTSLAKSIIRLLPNNANIVEGEIQFKGEDLTRLTLDELRNKIRWKEISMIPQNAMNGFDPVYTVGDQIIQVIRKHEPEVSKSEAKQRAKNLFEDLGIDKDRVDDYPHQFSGGMAQRAMVAMALSCSPSLILADEPTTALDVVIQDRILETIEEAQMKHESGMILITHDISVVAETCDRIAVVYGGRIVEKGNASTIIENPRHPYTLGLRNSFPDIDDDDQELISIPGSPPELTNPDEGCRFAPRCPFAEEECWETTPQSVQYGEEHYVECHRADEVEYIQEKAKEKATWLDMNDKTLNRNQNSDNKVELGSKNIGGNANE